MGICRLYTLDYIAILGKIRQWECFQSKFSLAPLKFSYPVRWILQSCSISIFPYQFNINYSVCLLINTNININYFQEGLSISILYQLLKKLPYQFQYQYILSISPYDIVKITNFLSISHCYQYQCWYQLSK